MSEVKVDEVLRLCNVVSDCAPPVAWATSPSYHTVRDKAAEVSADDAVPCGAFALVELIAR